MDPLRFCEMVGTHILGMEYLGWIIRKAQALREKRPRAAPYPTMDVPPAKSRLEASPTGR